MTTPTSAPAGWYEDPGRRGRMLYWDGASWLSPPGWYPDPVQPGSQRRWTGTAWGGRRPKHYRLIVVAAVSFLTLQGCATALSQAPTCNPHGPVSTPATTPFTVTMLLWLVGLVVAVGLSVVWARRGWVPKTFPLLLVVGSILLPLASWAFAAASCGL